MSYSERGGGAETAGPSATHASSDPWTPNETKKEKGLRIPHNPAGLPPNPLVGASDLRRSMVRWRGMYSDR